MGKGSKEIKLCSADWDPVVKRHGSSGFAWECACGQSQRLLVFGKGAEAIARAAWFAHKYPGWTDSLLPEPPMSFRDRAEVWAAKHIVPLIVIPATLVVFGIPLLALLFHWA